MRLSFRTTLRAVALWPLLQLVMLSSCTTPPLPEPNSNKPAALSVPDAPTTVKALLAGSHFIIEVRGDRREPWRFLVDTGSAVTLVSGDFARRQALKVRRFTHAPKRVRSITGAETEFDSVLIKEMRIGEATFRSVPALVFDPSELSAHLGLRIDGILGFPFFEGTRFTLDYPRAEFSLQRPPSAELAGSEPYFERYRTPRLRIQIGTTAAEALVDTGSDAALVLPSLDPQFKVAVPPRAGGTVGGLVGTMTSQVARLGDTLRLDGQTVEAPAVTLGAPHVAVGADLLRAYAVTFDTVQQRLAFVGPESGSRRAEPLRHTGLSFKKTPGYWRVEAVLPQSPADAQGLREGDLVVRIEGEPVAKWPLSRFLEWIGSHDRVVLTLLHGSKETPVVVPVYNLLPISQG